MCKDVIKNQRCILAQQIQSQSLKNRSESATCDMLGCNRHTFNCDFFDSTQYVQSSGCALTGSLLPAWSHRPRAYLSFRQHLPFQTINCLEVLIHDALTNVHGQVACNIHLHFPLQKCLSFSCLFNFLLAESARRTLSV
jgi:hypothetical protein